MLNEGHYDQQPRMWVAPDIAEGMKRILIDPALIFRALLELTDGRENQYHHQGSSQQREIESHSPNGFPTLLLGQDQQIKTDQ